MSGDNLHGKQPLKFYSEELTITKLLLIKKHFNFNYESKSLANSEQNYFELKKLLADKSFS
tara:strand:+ start:1143 stop:1325 length:183 start_codon:yes stop_codon:yes gene_type:complete